MVASHAITITYQWKMSHEMCGNENPVCSRVAKMEYKMYCFFVLSVMTHEDLFPFFSTPFSLVS